MLHKRDCQSRFALVVSFVEVAELKSLPCLRIQTPSRDPVVDLASLTSNHLAQRVLDNEGILGKDSIGVSLSIQGSDMPEANTAWVRSVISTATHSAY